MCIRDRFIRMVQSVAYDDDVVLTARRERERDTFVVLEREAKT